MQVLAQLRQRNLSGHVNAAIVIILGLAFLKYAYLQHFLPIRQEDRLFESKRLALLTVVQQDETNINALDALASFYQQNACFRQSEAYFLKELDVVRSAKSDAEATVLRKLAKLSSDSGQFDKASDCAQQAYRLDDAAERYEDAEADLRLDAFAAYLDARQTADLKEKEAKDKTAQKRLDRARALIGQHHLSATAAQILDNYQALIYIDEHNMAGLTRLGVTTGEL